MSTALTAERAARPGSPTRSMLSSPLARPWARSGPALP